MTMKITPESTVVTNVPTAGMAALEPDFTPALTIAAMTMAATPSAAKSTNGEVVVI